MLKGDPMKKMILSFLILGSLLQGAQAATVRTPNFVVTLNTNEPAAIASHYASQLESYRRTHAETFFGSKLPDWPNPCIVSISRFRDQGDGTRGGGATSFNIQSPDALGLKARDFEMILSADPAATDEVLKHECLHAVLYSKLGHLQNRWVDEGLCSAVENSNGLSKILAKGFKEKRLYPIHQIFEAKNYPEDEDDQLLFYAEAQSQVRFLLNLAGPRYFAYFITVGQDQGYQHALRHCYNYSVSQFQDAWHSWYQVGSPPNPYTASWVDDSAVTVAKILDAKSLEGDAPLVAVTKDSKDQEKNTEDRPYKVGYG